MDAPLTGNIIFNEGFYEARGVVGNCLTYGIIHVDLPEMQVKNTLVRTNVGDDDSKHAAPPSESQLLNVAQNNHV
jgi:hypothetical protein